MNTTYARNLNQSHLIIETEQNQILDIDGIEMFRYNVIPLFLSVREQRKNMEVQYVYDITGKRSVDQLITGKELEEQMLYRLLHSLDQACTQIDNYMLAENNILLKPEYIFTESDSEQVYFCYLPDYDKDIRIQLRELMEYLMQNVNHKDEGAVQLTYGVYQRVIQEDMPLHEILRDFKEHGSILIDKDEKHFCDSSEQSQVRLPEQVTPVMSNNREKNKVQARLPEQEEPAMPNDNEKRKAQIRLPERAMPVIPNNEREKRALQKESAKGQATEKIKKMLLGKLYTNAYQEETEIVYEQEDFSEPSHPTVCLTADSGEMQNQFVYQGMDRTRDFRCEKRRSLIGSNSKEVDICIPLPMVSRIHACVEVNGTEMYLEDLNSTNGTLVNGEQLIYRKKRLLKKGDIVNFAGEIYNII